MKKLTMDKWEEKYIVGGVKQFDEKNHMFFRPGWDTKINGLIEDWNHFGPPKEKAGYSVEEWAFMEATRLDKLFNLVNIDKPVPLNLSVKLMKALFELMKEEKFFLPQITMNMKADVTDPELITRKMKKVATWFGADSVGICKLDRRWMYSHAYTNPPYFGAGDGTEHASSESIPQEIPDSFQYAIVMCFEMDYDIMQYHQNYLSLAPAGRAYSSMAITNHYVSSFIKNLGFKAINCTTNQVGLSVPMAMQAGLGDIARNGLLITPKWGPRVRISKVITDLPLVPDSPIDFGVTEFCETCKLCAEKCPSQSISFSERTSEPLNISNSSGTLKWPINAETCRTYWARKKRACSMCIHSCPYNKPDTSFHKFIRWLTDHARWADRLYVKGDKMMGYGNPKPAENFWEEWKP